MLTEIRKGIVIGFLLTSFYGIGIYIYKNKIRATIAYVIFGLTIMMAPNVLIFLQKDAMIAGLLANGMTQEYIDSIFAVYSAKNIGIGIVLTIIGAVAGISIGYRILNRYFISGGMVEK